MSSSERVKHFRDHKRELKERQKYAEYLVNNPFLSSATEEEKKLAFQAMEEDVKKNKTKEKFRKYRLKRKMDTMQVAYHSELESGSNELPKPSLDQQPKQEAKLKSKRKIETLQLDRDERTVSEEDTEPVSKRFMSNTITASFEFTKRFYDNCFGFACSVCDRLWFKNDLRKAPNKCIEMLSTTFINENVFEFKVCDTCYKSLSEVKIPRLSRSNGFVYPPYPTHLPPLNVITERLVSPRIPFMHIRRLRFVNGSKGIIGNVINVPVDINEMVNALPRQLQDDYAFNVNIKRHQIHKSSYLAGMVKKEDVKAWLKYLLNKPLYRNIKVDETFFMSTSTPELPIDEGVDPKEPIIEPISETADGVHDMLLAKQHTLMWSEEKYLDMAPGMNQKPMNLIYDEHAEEMSFPSIYLGEPRQFNIDNVTPYMMASSEIRRRDRRGVKPEHVLYMAMKIMRLRLMDGLHLTFKAVGDGTTFTRADIENETFVAKCIEQNLSFLKSIPNSVQYWMSRKKDVFAMIRQLGKPTLFLTLSASEYKCSDLLQMLYRLKYGKPFEGKDPVVELNSDERTTLVNEDPVTCCVYFDKLVDTIMNLLKSPRYSPFGEYRVKDFFKRIEFQQRGSPHAHILLWLENDPKETLGEDMPATVKLIDHLCCLDPTQLNCLKDQTHNHTFTCYKGVKNEKNKKCRFGAPFWPVNNTVVLIPMTKEDGRRDVLQKKFVDMHRSLEFQDFDDLKSFLNHHRIQTYEHYMNVLRAGITRPRVFLKRTFQQRFLNNFNPWIANLLKSNMDIQYILEPYSCATYVVEYVNKTNRGISSLHREMIKLRDEYPDKDYTDILKELGIKFLNSVEMSSQEAAWYLLNLHMSESSRQVEFIRTTWPHERQRVRKTKKQMDAEELAGDSVDIWQAGLIENYEARPENLNSESLAQFAACYYRTKTGEYKRRNVPKVIRYCNYEMSQLNEYKREMVLLHIPFRNEAVEILDRNRFLTLYDERENEIMEARKEFESDIDIAKVLEYCKEMCVEENGEDISITEKNDEYVKSKALSEEFVQSIRDGNDDDIRMAVSGNMSAVVRKRENVMTAEEYCSAMRCTNLEQRDLILEAIHRMFEGSERKPLQIFLTGPAGCGKTFTMKLLMETYNRFGQQHNSAFNAYVACASTGMAAAAVNGTTVHSAFRICNSRKEAGLSVESLSSFRTAFRNVQIVFVDECSMIGSGLLKQINSRLQHILHDHDKPFAGMDMVFCGDLRQLPPVCQTPIYKRSRQIFCSEIVWQSLEYYPLVQVMRQSDVKFSSILTKIGNGEALTHEETATIESRFVTKEFVGEHYPEAIRLFFRVLDVHDYNNSSIVGEEVIEYVAQDCYTGYSDASQLASARSKVHKMKPDDTGGLPYMLKLLIGKPYMIRVNIDVLDGLVNGAIGTLRFVERSDDGRIKFLWLSFGDSKIGKLIRTKCHAHVRSNAELQHDWVPISVRIAIIQLGSKIISCKRTQFPLVEACAITIHKSQGGTYKTVVYEYDKSHEQQLVYVALSRATSLDGLYLTHRNKDHKFYHARGQVNKDLHNEFKRLEQHRLDTIAQRSRDFISQTEDHPTALSLCTLNVQSLKAHREDIITDFVIPKVKIMSLTETWVENDEIIEIPGFRPVSQFKRDKVRSGGVSIYENEESSSTLKSSDHELLKYEKQEKQVKRMSLSHDGVGDICAIETTINGQRALLVSVYISPGTPLSKIEDFFELNLMAYSPKAAVFKVVRENNYHLIPIVIGGDLNIDLRGSEGARFVEFMKETFDLELNSNPSVSTTRNNTCIEGVFSRHIDHLETRNYISYFSYHKPLLSITNVKDEGNK